MQPEPKRSVAEMHITNEGGPRTQRPSLLIDLLTGDLGSRSNRTPAETPVSQSTGPHTAGHSSHHSTNSSSTTKTTLAGQSTFNGATKRGEKIQVFFRSNTRNL